MPRASQQQFRDNQRRRTRTYSFDDDVITMRRLGDIANPALEEALRPFLKELTIPQAEAVRLVYFHGMTERSAARKLDIQLFALQKRLSGAYVKLTKALVEQAESDEYQQIRQWLTPAQKINSAGMPDWWSAAACKVCERPAAMFKPNSLGDEAHLVCPDCQ